MQSASVQCSSQLLRQPVLIPSWANICLGARRRWSCWSFMFILSQDTVGEEKRILSHYLWSPKQQHWISFSICILILAATSPCWCLRHLPVPGLVLWARNDFQENCSAVPFLGLGNGWYRAGRWLITPVLLCMLPTVLSFMQCHPSQCERCSVITHASQGTAMMPQPASVRALPSSSHPSPGLLRGKDISACLRSTIKGENKLADISFWAVLIWFIVKVTSFDLGGADSEWENMCF